MKNIGKSVLPDLLALQSEPDETFDDVDVAWRIRAALASGEELDHDLTALIWRSPAVRSIYQRLRDEAVMAFRKSWQEREFATFVMPEAAVSETDDESFVASGLHFHIVRNYATGKWMLTLQLMPDALEDLLPGTSVRVSDNGGLTWLDGRLDRQGSIDGFWEDADTNPRQRAAKFGLNIEFY